MSKKLQKARVLADMPHLGIANGDVVQGTAAQIEALASAHAVDSHPAAIKYAEDLGKKPIALPAPAADAPEARAAERAA